MALTRKMLAAMDIPAEKIDEIISAHTETVNAIKEERDNLKASADAADDARKELEKVKKELADKTAGDWEKKYTELKSEYDTFKADTVKKETKAKKESAYRALLTKAGISEKRIDTVMKVSLTAIDGLELDDKGEAKDADKIVDGVKKEWADFIGEVKEKGADVSNPPAGGGDGDGKKLTRAAELAKKYNENLYGKGKEN